MRKLQTKRSLSPGFQKQLSLHMEGPLSLLVTFIIFSPKQATFHLFEHFARKTKFTNKTSSNTEKKFCGCFCEILIENKRIKWFNSSQGTQQAQLKGH